MALLSFSRSFRDVQPGESKVVVELEPRGRERDIGAQRKWDLGGIPKLEHPRHSFEGLVGIVDGVTLARKEKADEEKHRYPRPEAGVGRLNPREA